MAENKILLKELLIKIPSDKRDPNTSKPKSLMTMDALIRCGNGLITSIVASKLKEPDFMKLITSEAEQMTQVEEEEWIVLQTKYYCIWFLHVILNGTHCTDVGIGTKKYPNFIITCVPGAD